MSNLLSVLVSSKSSYLTILNKFVSRQVVVLWSGLMHHVLNREVEVAQVPIDSIFFSFISKPVPIDFRRDGKRRMKRRDEKWKYSKFHPEKVIQIDRVILSTEISGGGVYTCN